MFAAGSLEYVCSLCGNPLQNGDIAEPWFLCQKCYNGLRDEEDFDDQFFTDTEAFATKVIDVPQASPEA